jgi:hypothetical protein
MRIARSLLAAVLCVGIAGCTPQPPVSTPSPSAEASSPTPTPTPTVEPLVKPAIDELVISPEGLGAIGIGRAYTTVDPATDLLSWDDTFCGFADDPNFAGMEYPNWKNTYSTDLAVPFLTEVTYDNGTPESPIIRITTFSSDIRTEGGNGIGSTVADLTSEFGDTLIASAPSEYYPYVVAGRAGKLVFWFSYETPDIVYMLQVIPAAEKAEWSYYMTACE